MFINGKLVINNENVECEYVVNKFIKYKEDEALNTIDVENEEYLRENNEFMFKIEFKNQKFSYTLKENNLYLEDNLECDFIDLNNKISFKYNLDEEIKEIIIQIV